MAYRLAQDFNTADGRFDRAAELAARAHPEMMCEVLNFRGALEMAQTRFVEAEATYGQALKLARKFHRPDQEASALVSFAWLAMSTGRFDEAIDRGNDALILSGSLEMQGLVAATLGNLGWSYYELGDYDAALDYYNRAAATADASGLTGLKLYWFTGVVNSYQAVHDYQAAELLARSTYQQSLALKNTQTTAECLNDLARIALRTSRLADAERYNKEALKIEEDGRDKFGLADSLLSAGRIAAAQNRWADAGSFCRRVLAVPGVEIPVIWQAQAAMAGVRDGEGNQHNAEQFYLKAIDIIETSRRSVNHDELRLSFLSSGIEVYGEYIDFLIRRGRPDDALRLADLSRARTLTEGLSTTRVASFPPAPRIDPHQLARRFNATILVYWLGEKHSYLWAVTPNKTECFTLPPASEIDPLVKSYRDQSLKSEDVLKTATATGEKLYAVLIEPAKKLIPRNSRVIVLPDASLNTLNFETLIVPGPQPHFWIEDVTITNAPSLSVLASAANRPPPKHKSLLLVGDAVPVPEFGPLPQARVEIQKIEPYFSQERRSILQGAQATPSAYLKSQPGRFSYLHFVTHGTASRARPLESAVILSKESGSDTYKLYARDIVAHPLNAELVTISACNGSGTRAYSGEGLVGLSWAFLRAGAHNVIGALWEVSDVSTPNLMDKMYAELAAGKDPATALRTAKLSLLHQKNALAKPFYWAPFQLYSGS